MDEGKSYILDGVTPYTVYDTVVDLAEARSYHVRKGGQLVNFAPQLTQSGSTSSVSFNLTNVQPQYIIDRYITMAFPVTFTFTGTSTSGNLLGIDLGVQALRAFPVNSCISSATIQVNNQSFTSIPFQFVAAHMHEIDNRKTNIYGSSFPSLPDNCQNYSQLVNATNNPLGSYTNSQFWQQARGSFPIKVLSNTPTSAVVEVLVTEPILCAPLLFYPDDKENGLYGVSTMAITLAFNNLARMWSCNLVDGNNITSISASIGISSQQQPSILVRYITPGEKLTKMISNKYLTYDVQNITTYVQDGGSSLAPGGVVTLQSQQINLIDIPTAIYIFVRRSNATLTSPTGYQYADSFASILNVNVTFNNGNFLGPATAQDLWRISQRNGMNQTWGDWVGNGVDDGVTKPIGVGSVLRLDPTIDFGLPDNMAPGTSGIAITLSYQVTVKNISDTETYIPALNTCIIYTKTMSIKNTQTTVVQQVLSPEVVENIPEENTIELEMVPPAAGISKDFKRFGKRLYKGLRTTAKTIKAIANDPLTKDVVEIAKSVIPLVGGAEMTPKTVKKRTRLLKSS